MANAKYVEVVDFISHLTEKLVDVDTDLPVYGEHISKLKQKLGADNYTYLRIDDGFNHEIVKVYADRIERGQGMTQPHTFAKGSQVKYILTHQAVLDIICQMDCCP